MRRLSDERSCWSGPRSPISWWSGYRVLEKEWKERREALRAAGELPEEPSPQRGGRRS